MAPRKPRAAPPPASQADGIAESVDRLSEELRILRQVLDEIRADFSWLTRNGLPAEPAEHVVIQRMALDPGAGDWGDKLQLIRFPLPTGQSSDPRDPDRLDRVAEDLKVAIEAAAQGQLEVVLTALDGVRGEIMATLKRRTPAYPTTLPDGPNRSPLPSGREAPPDPGSPGRLF